MTDKTSSARKARQRARDRAAGLVEVPVKVWRHQTEEIKQAAKRMREEAAPPADDTAP